MEPEVVRVMREHKAALLRDEQAAMAVIAQRWAEVEAQLVGQIEALAEDLAREKAEGRSATQAKLYRMGRYQRLLEQVRVESVRFAEQVEVMIEAGQGRMARRGLDHAADAIRASYSGVGAFFDHLPVEAVEHMVGLLGDGSPLGALLHGIKGDVASAISSALVRGTALGWNPKRVAREMVRRGRVGAQRAMVIARTEGLRVYREASRQQYQKSGVVEGFYRLSAHDDRVCPACLMSDGEFYALDETLREHAQGRCAMVPKVIGLKPPRWQHGVDWFRAQDAGTQRAILGKGRYAAWSEGKFDLDQLVTVKRNETWGDSVTPTPLSALLGA